MMEMMTGRNAETGPSVKLIPLLREIYGNELAVREEALPLMSPDGFGSWMIVYLGMEDPQVIEEEAEAA